MTLRGKTILVTGASGGIGLALAQELTARGARVLGAGRDGGRLDKARALVPRLVTWAGDLRAVTDLHALAAWSIANGVDGLVNNAGVIARAPVAPERVDEMLAVNLGAPMKLTALLVDHLKERPGAFILNVGSTLALAPVGSALAYSATKAGLHTFTRGLRAQLAGTSVRVIEAMPPPTDTRSGAAFPEVPKTPADEVARRIVRGLESGEAEIVVGSSTSRTRLARAAAALATENAPRQRPGPKERLP